MSLRASAPLSVGKKAFLAATATALLAGPVLFGLMQQRPDHGGPIFASSDPHLPVFEVASVKPNKGGMDMMTTLAITPIGFSAHNIVLKEIIREAYRIQDDQIVGMPAWVNSSRYDIEAKVATADTDALHKLSPGERGLMIQPLLADRFGLKVHTETRNLPVLTLTVAKGGPKLHEAKPGDTYPNGLKGPDGKGGAGMMLMGIGKITGQAVAMPFLVESLSRQLGSMVQDETGLKGNYDLNLEWTPDTATMKGPGDGPPVPGNPPPEDSAGPSLYSALQEQLGLKLESRKVPVQVLVIDHVQPPSEN
jgi:uncharacterized protein (TIGR03435 family)